MEDNIFDISLLSLGDPDDAVLAGDLQGRALQNELAQQVQQADTAVRRRIEWEEECLRRQHALKDELAALKAENAAAKLRHTLLVNESTRVRDAIAALQLDVAASRRRAALMQEVEEEAARLRDRKQALEKRSKDFAEALRRFNQEWGQPIANQVLNEGEEASGYPGVEGAAAPDPSRERYNQ